MSYLNNLLIFKSRPSIFSEVNPS